MYAAKDSWITHSILCNGSSGSLQTKRFAHIIIQIAPHAGHSVVKNPLDYGEYQIIQPVLYNRLSIAACSSPLNSAKALNKTY